MRITTLERKLNAYAALELQYNVSLPESGPIPECTDLYDIKNDVDSFIEAAAAPPKELLRAWVRTYRKSIGPAKRFVRQLNVLTPAIKVTEKGKYLLHIMPDFTFNNLHVSYRGEEYGCEPGVSVSDLVSFIEMVDLSYITKALAQKAHVSTQSILESAIQQGVTPPKELTDTFYSKEFGTDLYRALPASKANLALEAAPAPVVSEQRTRLLQVHANAKAIKASLAYDKLPAFVQTDFELFTRAHITAAASAVTLWESSLEVEHNTETVDALLSSLEQRIAQFNKEVSRAIQSAINETNLYVSSTLPSALD